MSRRLITILALAASPLAAQAHDGSDGGAHHGIAAGADHALLAIDAIASMPDLAWWSMLGALAVAALLWRRAARKRANRRDASR